MTRVERYESALKHIADSGGLMPDSTGHAMARIIARRALEDEIALPGPGHYRSVEDYDIAREWWKKHERADEIIFVRQKPLLALYYEPVAEHYQEARRLFREIAERLRNDFERDWGD